MSRPWVRSVLVSRQDRCLGSTRSDPVRSTMTARRALLLRVLRAKPGWAFLRGRGEGRGQLSWGEPRRRLNAIPYDGSYSVSLPLLLFAPAPLTIPRWRQRADRCVNSTTDTLVFVFLFLSLRLLVSIRRPRVFVLELSLHLTYIGFSSAPFFFLLSIGTPSFFSHGPVQYGTSWDPKRDQRGDQAQS